MAKIYLRKIRGEEVNPATGEVWKLEDVPVRWRSEVESLLDEEERYGYY
jgi:hypothetical protein